MKKILETTENIIRKIVSCKMLYYIASILLFTSMYYMDLKRKLAENNILKDGNHVIYFLIASAMSGIIVIAFLIFSKKLYKRLQPHIVYLILAIVLGGIYLVVVPLCAQSDEPAHIYRTFQVAKGEVISPIIENKFETKLPKSIGKMIQVNSSEEKEREYKKYYDIKEMMQIKWDKEEIENVVTVGNYHGSSYFPQVLGVKIGMLLELNPYYTAMLGRLTSLIITVLLLSFGIYKLPTHKLFATIVLLSPVVLSYAASFSADNMLLACIFLMLSYVLSYRHSKEKIQKRDYVILAILTFIVAISKMAYLPVIGMLFFIPRECFKTPKRKCIFASLFWLLGIGAALWWMMQANLDISSDAQTTNNWIYTNPIGYATILFRTTVNTFYSYLENMFAGYYLCHKQVTPSSIVPFVYMVIVGIAFFTDKNKENTTMMQKIITLGMILLSYVLISTAMYVYNTSYYNSVIIGVQGRYLIPLLLLAILFGNQKKWDVEESNLTNIALVANYTVYLAMMNVFLV